MATDKYNRTEFMSVQDVDGILEMDLVDNNFDLFEITIPMTYFTISRTYIKRPDLLSLALYEKMNYWWILAKVNNIDDWWNDLEIGDVIDVPNLIDIENWLYKVKSRNRK